MDIMMGLAAIKQTLDITKELRNIDKEMDMAQLKLRLSELIDGLLEAKEALQDAKARERELFAEIERLKVELVRKPRLKDHNGLLFELDADGDNKGEPYCNLCYVREDKMFRLIAGPYAGGTHRCSNCLGVFGKQDADHVAERATRFRKLGENLA